MEAADLAEQFKLKGNEAFKEKRYEDAVLLYTKAIEASCEPSSSSSDTNKPNILQYVYYNNRAAAYHLLQQYKESIQDATKSIELNGNAKENAKGYMRLGTTLWAEKKYAEALKQYTAVLAADPSNAQAQESYDKLLAMVHGGGKSNSSSSNTNNNNTNTPYNNASMQNLNRFRNFMNAAGTYSSENGSQTMLGPLKGGEWKHVPLSYAGLFLNLFLLLLSVAYLLSMYLFRGYNTILWQYFVGLTMLQQLITMYKLKLIPYITKNTSIPAGEPFLKTASKNFCSSLLLLLIAHTALRISPISFLVCYLAGYNVVDFLFYNRPLLAKIVGPNVYAKMNAFLANSRLQVPATTTGAEADYKKDQLLLVTGMIEAMLVFTIFLFGGSWFTLAYIQYCIYRYHNDRYVRFAFHSMKEGMESRVMSKPFVPAIVKRGYAKLLEGIELTAKLM